MSLFTHRIGLTINVLFLAAGGISALTSEALYRIAVVVILFMLRTLWAKAVIRRTIRQATTQDSLDASEYTLDAILAEMNAAHPSRP